ncbi:hypothetical protein KOW79_021951 [Hemibagrus wyckioides]|uniref:Kynurenine--oxoglutarate transaminase 1 n=1 Tax=Hemibagrus wyckioides TaxID=337641 RepID=A0A9D3N1I9_9TELE|nr:hypothetical protein KOW79_021951 [Hemibagrus wyckioides]
MSRKLHTPRTKEVTKGDIWLEFTQLAAENKVVNLGEGFPDFPPPSFVKEALCTAISGGSDMYQYTRTAGHQPLVKILAKFFGRILGLEIDPMQDILVTVGATEALFCAIQALIAKGDEIIIMEPFNNCYKSMTVMAGGKPVYVPLKPTNVSGPTLSSADWMLCPEELAGKLTSNTKAIIINNPNNPLGKVFQREELQMIADLCIKHDVFCISDESYEWLTYDGAQHVKIASFPGMWERTVTIGSGGKSFSATGWKEALAVCFQREYNMFGTEESYFRQLPKQIQAKRQRLANCMSSVGLQPIMPEGGYFMIMDISNMKVDLNDRDTKNELYDRRFVKWLIKEKDDSTLDAVEDILKQ